MNYGQTWHVPDFVNGYVEVVRDVFAFGEDASPRGALTRELSAATIIVEDGNAPMLPIRTGRGVNTALAALEAVQVVGGYSDAAAFAGFPHLASFMDDGDFHGAYGPRVGPQIDLVLRRLRDDPETRRAVVTVWDPERDAVEGVHNYPCTTELQFMVRRGLLDLHVLMRANDAWHGLAYDAFVFNQLQHTVARVLEIGVGAYVHHATSLHLYHEHWDKVDDLKTTTTWSLPILPSGVRSPAFARSLGSGAITYARDPSESWYVDKLATAAARATEFAAANG